MARTTINIAASLALAITLPAVSAQAQSPRTFVSAAGNDSNPCSFAAPCRHFQAAVAATSPGGEVDALDPAGYSPITISHSITIDGQGWSYIAPPAGGNAITINAVASDHVTIRGVSLNGAGVSGPTNGIVFNSGGSLTIENCAIHNMTVNGLSFFSTATSLQTLAVSNSYFNENSNGVLIQPESSGVITASIDRTGFFNNANSGLVANGAGATGALKVAATDSVAANNGFGFTVQSGTGHSVSNLSLTHNVAEGNSIGLLASGSPATLWLAQSTVTGNSEGFAAQSGSVINSYGDNYLAADTGTGTFNLVGKQ